MRIRVCSAKIHRATVTEANLNYVGSITIDAALLEATGIRPYQMVQITNCSNGALWRTYVLVGPAGRGDICLNGPPARHFTPGDRVIILAEADIDASETDACVPVVAFVDDHNRVTQIQRHEDAFSLSPAAD
jgi:aspartate 1-decarboxylase